MRRFDPRHPFFLAILPALSLAVALAATPARASPDADASAESDTDDDAETLLLVGMRGSLVSQATVRGADRGMSGVGVLYGERHGGWLTTELRADLLWDEAATSGAMQAALMYDAGGLWSPVVGAWMGYRGSAVDSNTGASVEAHDALLGLEVGGRLRIGPLTGEITGQAATAAISHRSTRGVDDPRDIGAHAVDFGELAELSFAVRVGLTF